MDWLDFLVDSDDSLFDISQCPPKVEYPEWTLAATKLFENAIAELDPSSPLFFENLALKVPFKHIDDIKMQYQNLVLDVEDIEAGLHDPPESQTSSDSDQNDQGGGTSETIGVAESSSQPKKKRAVPLNRRKGVPWTAEEHRLFLMGLEKFGKGDWRSISRHFVVNKSPTQVASHAQKYFRRLQSNTRPDRRRPSIHDIQTVSCTPVSVPQVEHPIPPPPTTMYNHHNPTILQSIPKVVSGTQISMPLVAQLIPPPPTTMYNHHIPTILPSIPKVVGGTQISMSIVEQPFPPLPTTMYNHHNPIINATNQDPNHVFWPSTSFTFPVANSMMINRPSSSNPLPYIFPPSGNQYWS